jgi:hypothetical protein
MKHAVEKGSGAMCVYTEFNKDWFRHSKFYGGDGEYTDTQQGNLISLLKFLAYVHYFQELKVRFCVHHAFCVSVYPPINF